MVVGLILYKRCIELSLKTQRLCLGAGIGSGVFQHYVSSAYSAICGIHVKIKNRFCAMPHLNLSKIFNAPLL